MQHVVHIFIGEGLVAFRDRFSSFFDELNKGINPVFFTALSASEENLGYSIRAWSDNDEFDETEIESSNAHESLINHFEAMYGRKVTVANPGNQSMVVVIWARLYEDHVMNTIFAITKALKDCRSNFKIEFCGFTHEAVSCFIPNPTEQLAPNIYKKYFDKNIATLKGFRPDFLGVRLIANRNMNGLAINLDEDSMARVCGSFASLLCNNYLVLSRNNINNNEFESFGLSSLIFDRRYYRDYLMHKLLIDRIENENIKNRRFGINKLAQHTDPLLQKTQKKIREFYSIKVQNAKAELELKNNLTASSIAAEIGSSLDALTDEFIENVNKMLDEASSIFEREALAALLLGEDSALIESSSVSANELTIDNLIDECAGYFVSLDGKDEESSILRNVDYKTIKKLRTDMRNIADANRQRQKEIDRINKNRQLAQHTRHHIQGNTYKFGNTEYKLDLDIDKHPLEVEYEPSEVTRTSIDLRYKFKSIRDQGSQGSCAAFAIASVIEAMKNDNNRYSPAFLYWNARQAGNETSKDCGATLYQVIRGAIVKGDCLEEKMPYSEKVFNVKPSDEAFTNALDCKILEAKSVQLNINHIKSALCEGFPVIISAKIFDSFSDTLSGFIPFPDEDEVKGGCRIDGHGRHALVLCGFSDKEKVFIARNSWGEDFGDDGYCYIPYSYGAKYFLQACIISSVSNTGDFQEEIKTLNFDDADSNIKTAILQILIHDDNNKLAEMRERANTLRTEWTYNIGKLQNTNTRRNIIDKVVDKIQEEIDDTSVIINNLNEARGDKLKDFRRGQLKRCIISGFGTAILWGTTIYTWYDILPIWVWYVLLALTIISTLVSGCLFGRFAWDYKKYKKSLNDEIQEYAKRIDSLESSKKSLHIKGYIYGNVLSDLETFKSTLQSKYYKRQNFNTDIVKLYETFNEEVKEMSPQIPYPFIALLTNDLLDKYYNIWKNKMLKKVNLNQIYTEYTAMDDPNTTDMSDVLITGIMKNDAINNTIDRGLRGFSMKEYVTLATLNQWQFLPNTVNNMKEVFPDLDQRATPFSPYQPDNTIGMAKYIFINGLEQNQMTTVNQYFPPQPPMLVNHHNTDMITVLSIVRFRL